MCLLIVYEVVCPPYKTDWIGVHAQDQVWVANSPIKWTVPDYEMQTNTLCVGNVVGYPHVSLNTLAAFMVIVRHALLLSMCVNSLPTLSCSNYTSFSFLLHIFLSFFRIISLSTLPSNSTLTKAKPECCVPPFLEWKPCHVFVDVHEWTSHTVTECLTVMLHCSHDSEAPHVCGSVLQFWPILTGVPESYAYYDSVWIAWMITYGG